MGFCFLTNSLLELKTLIIMAKFELKFIASDDENATISVKQNNSEIEISIDFINDSSTIFLDKSTAIKFAKTLRTEINKITESEVGNE